MDRLIATNSVPLASADTAPDTGTAQYATDGSPANGVPATIFPAYAFNAIQEELMAVIAGGDITPDRTDNAQVLAALKALFAAAMGSTSNRFSVAPAVASTDALPLGQATGRLLNIQKFTTVGTATYTPTPGTTAIRVTVIGGGGSGAGAVATGDGQGSIGSGGRSGSMAQSYLISGFSGVTVTVGAGGAAATGFASNNGGTSSFGNLLTAPGGNGGTAAGPSSAFPFLTSYVNGTVSSGGNIFNDAGVPPMLGQALSASVGMGGFGGSSPYGSGGGVGTGGVGGAGATGYGGGGGGCCQLSSGASLTSGPGSQGVVIIEEFGTV